MLGIDSFTKFQSTLLCRGGAPLWARYGSCPTLIFDKKIAYIYVSIDIQSVWYKFYLFLNNKPKKKEEMDRGTKLGSCLGCPCDARSQVHRQIDRLEYGIEHQASTPRKTTLSRATCSQENNSPRQSRAPACLFVFDASTRLPAPPVARRPALAASFQADPSDSPAGPYAHPSSADHPALVASVSRFSTRLLTVCWCGFVIERWTTRGRKLQLSVEVSYFFLYFFSM
jgi:hypothetical protein